MKALLRLTLVYFTGTPLLRGITALGLLGVVGGCGALLYLPPLLGQSGGPSRLSLGQEAFFSALPVAGVLCIALGASLLPALVARLASSHYLYVLPHARPKVLASVFATITLVALIAAGATTVYYVRTPLALDVAFSRGFVVALLTYSLLYVVICIAGLARGPIGLLVGSIAVIVTLALPLRIISAPSRSYLGLWILLALAWASFAAAFVLAPRLGPAIRRLAQNTASAFERSSYGRGGEIDYLIGTARPWTLALGQVVPILLATYFLRGFGRMAPSSLSPWLFFLVILSVLSGTTASRAAMRSRALWLRTDWSRTELFERAEAAFWRHNGYSLGTLLVMLAGLGAAVHPVEAAPAPLCYVAKERHERGERSFESDERVNRSIRCRRAQGCGHEREHRAIGDDSFDPTDLRRAHESEIRAERGTEPQQTEARGERLGRQVVIGAEPDVRARD
jgi:hypothetical protein